MGSHLCQLWSSVRSEHPLWEDVTRDMIPCVYVPPSSFPGSLKWTFSFLFSSLSCVVSTNTLERSLSLDFTALETFCACSSSTCIFIHVWVSSTESVRPLSTRFYREDRPVWSCACGVWLVLVSRNWFPTARKKKKTAVNFLLLNILCDAYWVSYSRSGIDESEGKCILY